MKQKIYKVTIEFIDGDQEEITVCDTVGEGIELMDTAIKIYRDYSDKWKDMRVIPFSSIRNFFVQKEVVEIKN